MKIKAFFAAILTCVAGQSFAQVDIYLSDVMPESLLEYSALEVVSDASIETLVEGDNTFIALRVFPYQPRLNSGIRAEISLDPVMPADATVTYTWRLRLPSDFQSDAPRNRWWVMAQWHDQPDLALGETWETKPDTSPAVSLSYGELDGVNYLSMFYGAPEQRHVALIEISLGEWHDLKMVIDWSQDANGSAVFYMDDMITPKAQAQGRNMYNAARNFFKLGIYRDPSIRIDTIVHIDDINITAQ